jgi:hypothetical protein
MRLVEQAVHASAFLHFRDEGLGALAAPATPGLVIQRRGVRLRL